MTITGDASLVTFESIALVLAGLWVVTPTMTPALFRMFPAVYAALAALAIAWTSGVVLLAVYQPALLHPLTALALVGVLLLAWRNRVSYGRTRGLPPGSLSLRTSFRALVDRSFYRETAARLGPVFKTAQFHQKVVCLVGLERAQRLLHRHEEALGPSVQPFNRVVAGGFLRYMNVETHGVYGPLFRQALSGRVVGASAQAIAGISSAVLADAAYQARTAASGSVAVDALLEQVVEQAFLRALFGISPGTPAFESFQHAYAPLRPLGLAARPTRRVAAAVTELRHLLASMGREWRSLPTDAVPVCALAELSRIDARMPDDTCLDNLVFIHKISGPNLSGLLRWVLATLGRHPEWISRLRSQLVAPLAHEGHDLTDRIVTETLRLSQSEYLYRRLRQDVPFDGFVLPKGWLVRVCVAESHRDAALFEAPDSFNPDRFLSREYPRSAYMPFGGDRHACNGVALTGVVCRAFLDVLTRQYDWGVEHPDPLEREFRHWSHWRPSRHMGLRLEARAASGSSQGSSPETGR